jgi:hypothetical protein
MITAADEDRHPAGQDLNWSESYYFTFFDAHTRIGGFFRMGLEENRKRSNIWCHILRDGKPLYNRFRLDLPYCEQGLTDVSVGGLRFCVVESLRTFNIAYIDRHLSIDLQWQGFHDVFDMRESTGEMSASVAKGHYEQMGEIHGELILGGESISLCGYGFRDHSWGVRDWEGVKIWKTCVGQFGKEFAFASGEITETSGNIGYLGFIFNGRETIGVSKVEIDVDDEAKPTRGITTLHDNSGATTRIDVEFIYVSDMQYDFNLLHECYVNLRMGNKTCHGIVEINRRL